MRALIRRVAAGIVALIPAQAGIHKRLSEVAPFANHEALIKFPAKLLTIAKWRVAH